VIQALALLLLGILPLPDGVLRDRCDCIDDNFFYDEYGRLVFEQHIFIDFNWATGEEDVVDWRLVKSESQTIRRDWANGGYIVLWLDGDKWREVRSRYGRVTWLQYDCEVEARNRLPKEQRRGLSYRR
jgi:hypothetical protein